MAASLIVLRPRKRQVGRARTALREIIGEVLVFERTHAKLAWGTTLCGLLLGLALKSL